jgi:hypothetical protein
MGFLVKLVMTAAVVVGFHYGVKQFVAITAKAELGDPPPAVTITIDPDTLRRSQEIGRAVDTSAQRAAIESASRQIEE